MLMFEWGKMVIWSCKHPTVRIDVKRTMRYVYFNNKKYEHEFQCTFCLTKI